MRHIIRDCLRMSASVQLLLNLWGGADLEQAARDYEKQLDANFLNLEIAFPNFVSDSEADDSDSDLSSVGWQGLSGALVSEGSTI